jgi:hypothetical protein
VVLSTRKGPVGDVCAAWLAVVGVESGFVVRMQYKCLRAFVT